MRIGVGKTRPNVNKRWLGRCLVPCEAWNSPAVVGARLMRVVVLASGLFTSSCRPASPTKSHLRHLDSTSHRNCALRGFSRVLRLGQAIRQDKLPPSFRLLSLAICVSPSFVQLLLGHTQYAAHRDSVVWMMGLDPTPLYALPFYIPLLR